MTEITRVPLQPLAKGSLAKVWLGVGAAIVLAAGIAWAAMPPGVSVETIIRSKSFAAMPAVFIASSAAGIMRSLVR